MGCPHLNNTLNNNNFKVANNNVFYVWLMFTFYFQFPISLNMLSIVGLIVQTKNELHTFFPPNLLVFPMFVFNEPVFTIFWTSDFY